MLVKRWIELLCAATLVCGAASATSGPSAGEVFADALELAREGEFEAAAARFEEAYRISPNYAVLYNLGQAYVALGRPVEVVATLEKYLELGGTNIAPARRREVQDLVVLNQKRIGYASLSVEPANAEVLVDGRPQASGPALERLALPVGRHGIAARADGYAPFITSIDVARDQTAALSITLRADELPPPKLGQLAIQCPIPETRVSVDNQGMRCSGPDPALAAVGRHEVACARDGYLPVRAQVEVTDASVTHFTCDLKIDPRLPSARSGMLTLALAEQNAEVRVDGRPSPHTVRLPAGTHQVLVRHSGFEDWTRTVVVRPGFPVLVDVTMRPTPEHALELRHAADSRRNWAYAIGGAGVVLIGTSALLYADNNQRYSSWQRDNDALSRELQQQNPSPGLSDRTLNLQRDAASIQGRDDLAIGGLVLGGALVSYALISWLSARP